MLHSTTKKPMLFIICTMQCVLNLTRETSIGTNFKPQVNQTCISVSEWFLVLSTFWIENPIFTRLKLTINTAPANNGPWKDMAYSDSDPSIHFSSGEDENSDIEHDQQFPGNPLFWLIEHFVTHLKIWSTQNLRFGIVWMRLCLKLRNHRTCPRKQKPKNRWMPMFW